MFLYFSMPLSVVEAVEIVSSNGNFDPLYKPWCPGVMWPRVDVNSPIGSVSIKLPPPEKLLPWNWF